jgi:hypothetical protein
MTDPLRDTRSSEWLTDLEELADLAAETVAPQEVTAARRRRRGYSATRLVGLLDTARAGGEDAAPPAAIPWAAAPPAAIPWAAAPPAPTPPAGLPPPRPHPLRRRRLLGPALATLGTAALCAGALLHLSGPDPAAPLTSGPGYSTPSPGIGGVAMQPAPLDPTLSPATPGPASAALQQPAAEGTAPAAAPTVITGPATTGRPPAPAPTRPPTAAPAPPPSTAPATVPTGSPSPGPTATPAPALAVRTASLSMGTCQDHGSVWLCPETATFTFAPGAAGSLTFSIVGTAVSCSGASSAFDFPQQAVDIPAGTTTATVTSALTFPSSSHPAATGAGQAASAAAIQVTAPNRVSSASQSFGSASCP